MDGSPLLPSPSQVARKAQCKEDARIVELHATPNGVAAGAPGSMH